MSVQKFLDKIKNGRYGADITDAIIGGIKKCYDDASVNHDNANMEVKMARGTHNTLNDRLDNVDEIQAQTNAQLSEFKKYTHPSYYKGAIVTFIDDDCKSEINRWIQIANEKNIKLSFSCVTDWVGTSGYASVSELKTIQEQGHDILNHTKGHKNNWSLTDEEIRLQITDAIEFLKGNGFKGYDVIVYPGTVPNDNNKKKIVREYGKYGISNIYSPTSKAYDNYYMSRIDADYKTLDELKNAVDTAEQNEEWLLVLTHSWRADGDVDSRGTFSIEKIRNLIDYIRSKSIPILPFLEAEKLKGNVLSIGDYDDKDSLYLTHDGKMNKDGLLFNRIDDSYEVYEIDTTTKSIVTTTYDSIFNKGGVLETYRSSQKHFTYQLYYTWDSNDVYKRRLIELGSSPRWGDFEKINEGNLTIKNYQEMDAPITAYEADKETIVTIATNKDTFKSTGGVMRVYRSSLTNFSYATFTPWNSNTLFMRKWRENSSWGNDSSGLPISPDNPSWSDWVQI